MSMQHMHSRDENSDHHGDARSRSLAMLVGSGLVGGIIAIAIVSIGAWWSAEKPALGFAGISAIVVLASVVLQFAVAMVSADYRRRAAEARLRSLEERGERQLRDAMRSEALRNLGAR